VSELSAEQYCEALRWVAGELAQLDLSEVDIAERRLSRLRHYISVVCGQDYGGMAPRLGLYLMRQQREG
jgi:hypothetical protein